MAKEQATEFLAKLVTEPELQTTVKENYRQMLCDIARKAGLVFSAQELQQAVAEENCRLTDDMLYEVVGGVGGVGGTTNITIIDGVGELTNNTIIDTLIIDHGVLHS